MPEIGDTQDHGSVFAGRVSHTSVASALQSNAKAAYVKYSQQRTMRRLLHNAQMERDAAVTRITLDSRADAAALQLASKLAMRITVAQWRDGVRALERERDVVESILRRGARRGPRATRRTGLTRRLRETLSAWRERCAATHARIRGAMQAHDQLSTPPRHSGSPSDGTLLTLEARVRKLEFESQRMRRVQAEYEAADTRAVEFLRIEGRLERMERAYREMEARMEYSDSAASYVTVGGLDERVTEHLKSAVPLRCFAELASELRMDTARLLTRVASLEERRGAAAADGSSDDSESACGPPVGERDIKFFSATELESMQVNFEKSKMHLSITDLQSALEEVDSRVHALLSAPDDAWRGRLQADAGMRYADAFVKRTLRACIKSTTAEAVVFKAAERKLLASDPAEAKSGRAFLERLKHASRVRVGREGDKALAQLRARPKLSVGVAEVETKKACIEMYEEWQRLPAEEKAAWPSVKMLLSKVSDSVRDGATQTFAERIEHEMREHVTMAEAQRESAALMLPVGAERDAMRARTITPKYDYDGLVGIIASRLEPAGGTEQSFGAGVTLASGEEAKCYNCGRLSCKKGIAGCLKTCVECKRTKCQGAWGGECVLLDARGEPVESVPPRRTLKNGADKEMSERHHKGLKAELRELRSERGLDPPEGGEDTETEGGEQGKGKHGSGGGKGGQGRSAVRVAFADDHESGVCTT